jgi:hypothetical protein
LASEPSQVRGGAEDKGDEGDEGDKADALAEEKRLNRRLQRAQIRDGLRYKAGSKALRGCGRTIISMDGLVSVTAECGVAHYSGLSTCGLIWMCPVCQAKIRHRRALKVEKGLNRALEMGHGIEFITLTCRHYLGQGLADLFGRSQQAWQAMGRDRAFKALKAQFGLRFITVREVTHSALNGWHPHFHLAVITWVPLTPAQRSDLEDGFWHAWSHQLQRVGLSALRGPGVLVKPCTSTDGLAAYLCKVTGDDGAMRSASMELARSDLKQAKPGHRTPEQIGYDFVSTGEIADLALLQEYWKATKRRRMMTWSKGLAVHLGLDEIEETDEQLAAAEVGGEVLMRIGRTAWGQILALGLAVHVLEVAEQSGREGLVALMRAVAPDDWWYTVQPPLAVPTG